MKKNVSIAEAKRDLSRLVNRAAYGHEVIILASRGQPKAVLLGIEDYEHLRGTEQRIVKLGGLWQETPEITEAEIAQARQEMWGRVGKRTV